ncbi:MAG TPA: DUF523 domain-containing protein [Bacilli bacterium]|nr:DUF523 domain-containing protein [Bacilli bacterium]
MILISACLAGNPCRYDGTDCKENRLSMLVEEGKAAFVCPEVLGGLPTPREPAEIQGGNGEDVLAGRAKVIDKTGKDVTDMFIKGAYKALEVANSMNATQIVLKENSPSCGSMNIYNGKFTGEKMAGIGVTAALLRKHGFTVLSEHELDKLSELH